MLSWRREATVYAGSCARTRTRIIRLPRCPSPAGATGGQVIGALPADDPFQDDTFRPDRPLRHDDVLRTGEFTLRAVHTPGHVSNHFCFLLEEEEMLFAGDHIMNGSTVVIVPPGGDMKAYIDSLRRLLDYPITFIAPGHGEVMEDSRAVVEWLVAHRLKRERKVIAGLEQLQRASPEQLVRVVYDDVAVSLHPMAILSLTAHLIKLRDESRAVEHADATWALSSRAE